MNETGVRTRSPRASVGGHTPRHTTRAASRAAPPPAPRRDEPAIAGDPSHIAARPRGLRARAARAMPPADRASAEAAALDGLSLSSSSVKGEAGGAGRGAAAPGLAPHTPAAAGRPPCPPRSHGSAASIEHESTCGDAEPVGPLGPPRIAPPALADAHEPLLDPSEDRYTMYPIK